MAESWYQPFKEFIEHLKALGTAGAGKLGVETGSHAVEHGALGIAGMASGTLGGVLLYGGFGVVSAAVNQIEYGAARGRIADFYHDELAAKLGKSKDNVRDDDIDILAKGDKAKGIAPNQTIAHEIAHERKIRNLGIAASFVASLSVYTLMHTLIYSTAAIAVAAAAPAASVVAPVVLTGLALAAKVAVGVLAYMAIKRPLMEVGKTVLGLNETTTHDLILGIAKDREHGKAITREQVAEVFISNNEKLSEYIKQRYGAEYDHLPLAEKVMVSADLANILPTDKIAQNINSGVANASELAFTAQGDISGVLPKVPSKEKKENKPNSLLSTIGNKCRNMVKAFNQTLHPEKAYPIPAICEAQPAQKSIEPKPESPIVEFNEGPSFVERYASHGANPAHKGFVNQLAERSAQQQANHTHSSSTAIQHS